MPDAHPLDDLVAKAATLTPAADAAGAASGPDSAPVPAELKPTPDDGNTRALCIILALFRTTVSETDMVFSPPLVAPARLLGDDKLPTLCAPWGRVLTHYGVDLGKYLDDSPVLDALFTTGPVLAELAREVTAELRARRAKPVQGERTDQAPPAAAAAPTPAPAPAPAAAPTAELAGA